MNWSMSSDYCTWEGVSCDHKTRDVIGLDLSCSQLEGAFLPNSTLFQLSHNDFFLSNQFPQEFGFFAKGLTHLNLSSTRFSGRVPSGISHLHKLVSLDLSLNYNAKLEDDVFKSLLQNLTQLRVLNLYHLELSSCNMKEFPHFSRDVEIVLDYVDLSNNDIYGEIPHWIGSVGEYLNISHNGLTGGLEQLPWNSIRYIDLRSNKLDGSLPSSICNSSSLEVLNLSHNKLSGLLPNCRTNLPYLLVFDLRMNDIQGNLPANLSNFFSLETINLNGNKLEGKVPSSFIIFNSLRVLDLGNNQISDTFPQYLEVLPNLRVLVLKSNKFHGIINTISKVEHPVPSLRIIDLSYNEFWGPLPTIYFRNFKAMINGDVKKIERKYMGVDIYYSDSMSLVIKGVDTELVKILTVFTTIDLSGNNFEGKIDEYIGNLVLLRYLNLSHSYLTGHIPSSVGELIMLESLDLSFNRLEGEIPHLLSSMYTLACLNLSFNQLKGRIPVGPQFNTFENDSYVGNLELCGRPLSKQCEHDFKTKKGDDCDIAAQEEDDDYYFFSGFTWEAVVIGYGCGVVPAFIIGYFMLVAGKPKWFAGIIARELGLKIRRMEIKWR